MDSETTINQLKEKVKAFSEARDWDQFHNAKELAIALSIEASEILEHFRWKTPEEVDALFNRPEKREEIEDEMADVLSFLIHLGQRYDIDLSEALVRKMAKNDAKYPVEKAKGKHSKYNEL